MQVGSRDNRGIWTMSVRLRLLLVLSLQLGLSPLGIAQQAAPPDASPTLEELEAILVTGERPGPALWKVSTKKGNTLWILPVFGPLPDRLNWQAREVQEVIRHARAVYIGGRPAAAAANKRTTERAAKAIGNKDGKLLYEVLPPDVYARFEELSRRFADGPARFQRYRPYYAVEFLRDIAMTRLHLSSDGGVVDKVRSLASYYLVEVRAIKPPSRRERDTMVRQLEKTPREADVPCVRAMLERMELELRESIDRANSWTAGDLHTLRGDQRFQSNAVYREACKQFLQGLAAMDEHDAASRRALYSSYEAVLRKDKSALALVWASDLLDADGLAARFRKAGYVVEEPKQRPWVE
jgi:uncharacterized protein YbaP (TraB family)